MTIGDVEPGRAIGSESDIPDKNFTKLRPLPVGAKNLLDVSWETLRGRYTASLIASEVSNFPKITPTVFHFFVDASLGVGSDTSFKHRISIHNPVTGEIQLFVRAGPDIAELDDTPWFAFRTGESDGGLVTTTDNTPAEILMVLPEEGEGIAVDFTVKAMGITPAGKVYYSSHLVVAKQISGVVSIIQGLSTKDIKTEEGGLAVNASVVSNEVIISVTGKTGQEWNWTLDSTAERFV